MTTEYENYDGTHYTAIQVYNDGTNKKGEAMTFTVGGTGHTVTSVQLCLSKTGSPTGTLTASIRATSGGAPTGGDLCSGTMSAASISSETYYAITQSPEYTLSPNVKYAICLLISAGGSSTSVYVRLVVNYPDGYGSGQAYYTNDQGSTWAVWGNNYSALFQVWGDPLVSIPTVTTQAASGIGVD